MLIAICNVSQHFGVVGAGLGQFGLVATVTRNGERFFEVLHRIIASPHSSGQQAQDSISADDGADTELTAISEQPVIRFLASGEIGFDHTNKSLADLLDPLVCGQVSGCGLGLFQDFLSIRKPLCFTVMPCAECENVSRTDEHLHQTIRGVVLWNENFSIRE